MTPVQLALTVALTERNPVDKGCCAGRSYLEKGRPVTVILGWRGKGPRNVLIEREDGSRTVRPFRGLRVPR